MNDALIIFRLQPIFWQFVLSIIFGVTVLLVLIVVATVGQDWLPAKPEPDDAAGEATRRRVDAVVYLAAFRGHRTMNDAINEPEATDRLFDTTPRALAERFGERTRQMMRDGRDPFCAARLAFSFAFKVRPVLRVWECQ